MSTVDVGAARRHLEALFASPPAGSLIEVRFRSGERMHQSFHRVDAVAAVVAEIERRAGSTDVFVGVVARTRRGGGRRDLVRHASVLWADCDSPAAVVALRAFRPAPSILVATGRPSGRHAYWLLREPVALEDLERANRRLAWALGADLACSEPARILRPAGSIWHKASPPVAVRLLRLSVVDRHELDEVVGQLADVPPARAPTGPRRRLGASGDPLLAIATTDYVERLTGRVPRRGGKVRCPFHEDQTPSLQCYPDGTFFCFGCRAGGSVYDFAAGLWSTSTKGRDFVQLREQLTALLLPLTIVGQMTDSWTPDFPI